MTTPHDAAEREPTYTNSPAQTKTLNDNAITSARAEYDASEKAAVAAFEGVAGFPTVASISPTTAARPTDTQVTVTGTNFDADTVVQVDGVDLATTLLSASQVRATLVAPGSAGTKQVGVANGPRRSNTSATFTWT